MPDRPESLSPKPATFRAVLRPSRSLSEAGFVVLMCGVSAVSFLAGVLFYAIGAWPVFGFLGLDVALLFAAFRLSYRSGRAFEIVELDGAWLSVVKVAPSREARGWRFNPFWVRLDLAEQPGGGSVLTIASAGERVRVAASLSDPERRELAAVLADALARWRHGPR